MFPTGFTENLVGRNLSKNNLKNMLEKLFRRKKKYFGGCTPMGKATTSRWEVSRNGFGAQEAFSDGVVETKFEKMLLGKLFRLKNNIWGA